MIKKKDFFSILFASLIMLATIATPVGAIGENAQDGRDENKPTTQQINQPEDAGTGRLADAKLKICQGKEQKIKNIFTNTNQLGQGQLNLFDNIIAKVERFYEDKGLQIENYDTMLGQVKAARTAAQTAMNNAAQIANEFSCDSDDPKGSATQFRTQVQEQIKQLKTLRVEIKSLISAIKEAMPAEETSEE